MESFNKWPLYVECLSEAAFFSSGTKLHQRACFVYKATIKLKQTNVFSVTGPGHLVSCFYCGLTRQNLKDSDCIWTKDIEYNPLYLPRPERTEVCHRQVILQVFCEF